MKRKPRPKIVKGRHTTFVHNPDGTVEMITDWDLLAKEVKDAIKMSEKSNKPVKTKSTKL